eukprot:CAMPEP_0115077094 /NCGR_PEP_ID=MMETSP0227-20121206/16794_1 /TAXON_ID=89957 /ORGANISM="Polarella glacialis, Strain CCMP 1383" /LENGTH=110 /DNA_ID=CAMNT_0002464313 /DNA_START=100 /DNA_END=433 /DNA_ORIENTATION=+
MIKKGVLVLRIEKRKTVEKQDISAFTTTTTTTATTTTTTTTRQSLGRSSQNPVVPMQIGRKLEGAPGVAKREQQVCVQRDERQSRCIDCDLFGPWPLSPALFALCAADRP